MGRPRAGARRRARGARGRRRLAPDDRRRRAPDRGGAQAATGNVSPASPVAAPGTPGAGATKPAEAKPAVPAPAPGLPVPVPAAGAARDRRRLGHRRDDEARGRPGDARARDPRGHQRRHGHAPRCPRPARARPSAADVDAARRADRGRSVGGPTPEPDRRSRPRAGARRARRCAGARPSRTLPPRDDTEPGRTPSRRTLGVLGGAALVVAAVVVVLILTLGGNDTPPAPNQVADTVARTTTSEPGRTQSTRQARIDRADTPVIVLNATGVNGLARQVADRLQSTGYQAAVDNSTSRPQTLIGYKSGADARGEGDRQAPRRPQQPDPAHAPGPCRPGRQQRGDRGHRGRQGLGLADSPPMSIDGVLLARHGETDDNAARRFQGHRDPPLNELGRAQAPALGEELAGAGIRELWSSPLLRARETATIAGAAARPAAAAGPAPHGGRRRRLGRAHLRRRSRPTSPSCTREWRSRLAGVPLPGRGVAGGAGRAGRSGDRGDRSRRAAAGARRLPRRRDPRGPPRAAGEPPGMPVVANGSVHRL